MGKTFLVGQRVELSPHMDLWVMGCRYGFVRRVTKFKVHVKVDRLERVRLLNGDDLEPVDYPYQGENGRMVYACCHMPPDALGPCVHKMKVS